MPRTYSDRCLFFRLFNRSVAEYLSHYLPHQLLPDDVFLTPGANQAIEVVMAVLSRPGANILLPKPGYPFYEARAACSNVEVRHFDLLPEKGWEVDLESVKALVDDNTVAIVIINPGNPCGNVFTSEHLQEMKSIATYVLVASRLCRWELLNAFKIILNTVLNPATIVQGAVPHILEKTTKEFFSNINNILKEAVNAFYTIVQEIPCFTCPYKPDGAMSIKLNLSFLEGINDDMDFCTKLAHEESVIILPGMIVGLKNWLRLTFAMEPAILEEGLER
ncbi:hypothetical protein RND71_015424 [Anisodus tanguticus]|uniref:Aminotransferase class I/classII large domain-containing protein n=1 Tax=Anisodus tanguticus TaxID=243964 RepID=A0AAE1S600_9SOLA|nr:hypothetical protein RND71_015424 [Anisodus tanguticus]